MTHIRSRDIEKMNPEQRQRRLVELKEELLQHVWMTFRGIEANTKQAVIEKLQMIGIEAKDKWWSDAKYAICGCKSGRIEYTTFIRKEVPNAALEICFIEMHRYESRRHMRCADPQKRVD